MESTLMTGQKVNSKTKNTLRAAIKRFRRAKAQMATSSARQLNEHLLQVRLSHLHVAHDRSVTDEALQQLGQALGGVVHRTLDPALALGRPEHARRPAQQATAARIEAEGDDVP